jgi:hypothetical protein
MALKYPVRLFSLMLAITSFCVPADKPRESIEIERILEASQGAPPELSADLKLQLVEKSLIRTKEVCASALRDAFDHANLASFKLPLVSTAMGAAAFTDSDAGMVTYASLLHADTLSLQLRTVLQLLHSDPKVALDAFSAIPGPQLPSLSCSNANGLLVGPVLHNSRSALQRCLQLRGP